MAITAFPFDSEVVGTDSLGLPIYDNVYSSNNMRDMLASLSGDGVSGFGVYFASERTVKVAPGVAVVDGTIVVSDAVISLEVPTGSGYKYMYFAIVVKVDLDTRSASVYCKQTTSSYSYPNLTRSANVWELGLANIYAPNGDLPTVASLFDTRASDSRCGTLVKDRGGLHIGRDLSEVLKNEIPSGGDVWDALHNRANSGNFTGLFAGDYASVSLKDTSVTASTSQCFVIAGFDPYYGTTPSGISRHAIYFVSREPIRVSQEYSKVVLGANLCWNSDAFNNGMSTDKHPYILSDLAIWEDAFAKTLPDNVYSNLLEFRLRLEERFDSSNVLTSSNGASFIDTGRKCWSLSETEIFGRAVYGTRGYSEDFDCQLELFKRASERNYHDSFGKFWLRTVADGNSTSACYVGNYRQDEAIVTNNQTIQPRPGFMLV